MFPFFLFCLATVGLTAILVDGSIFARFRERLAEEARFYEEKRLEKKSAQPLSLKEILHRILSCYQCCGFWSGLFCGFFLTCISSHLFLGTGLLAFPLFILMWFCCGTVGSLLAHVYRMLVEFIYVATMYLQHLQKMTSGHDHQELQPHEHQHQEEEPHS